MVSFEMSGDNGAIVNQFSIFQGSISLLKRFLHGNKQRMVRHWRIRGAPRRAPPQQDQFLSFSHTFLPKSVCVGVWRPPPQRVGGPPTGNPGSATVRV